MKTYLFDTLNRYKRFSENLDVKTILCNKSWWVFNDIGEKELYIFEESGTIYVTFSGIVKNGTWKYIPANRSIILSVNEQSVMVHPAFVDNNIFALQLDGTQNCMFLIDENNRDNFIPNTLTELKGYFAEKERKAIAYEEEQRRIADEELRIKEEKLKENEIEKLFEELGITKDDESLYMFSLGTVMLLTCIVIQLIMAFKGGVGNEHLPFYFSITLLIFLFFFFLFASFLASHKKMRKDINEYIAKNPNDWRIPYIIEKYNSYHPKHKI